ncbi:MAG: hypothetical protein KDD42_08255, partial [Bdellovibrionales bacterium]|nr:hypothetical protein [Bdellovibrionales bacterium]
MQPRDENLRDQDQGPANGGTDAGLGNAEITGGSQRFLAEAQKLLKGLVQAQDPEAFRELHWTGTFEDYLTRVIENPSVAANAFQRIHQMILAEGVSEAKVDGESVPHYTFFDDPHNGGKDAIFGIDKSLDKLVDLFESGANRYGTEKRIILLQGPVGSSKSTIVRLLKQGLERYSRTDDGAVFSFGFKKDLEGGNDDSNVEWAPLNEDPLAIIPRDNRAGFLKQLNAEVQSNHEDAAALRVNGDLSPFSRARRNELLEQYQGDMSKVLDHVVVRRIVISEEDRVGIGTFQPKDAKSQDSTELTGDINFRKIAQSGKDSDPAAFNFDGELCVANRGMMEFIEVLKLDTELLYELLTASQEKMIKPKKFQQTEIDEVLIGHTNEPEYEKLRQDRFMEALRDRTVTVKVPYITRLEDEMRIYDKDYSADKVRGHFIAPHTIEVASMFAVLSRLVEPKKASLDLVDKMHLYNGRGTRSQQFTEQMVGELKKAAAKEKEGHEGISPRFIQDTLSACLVDAGPGKGINPFMVLNAFENRLPDNPHVNSDKEQERLKGIIQTVRQEYEEVIKSEVQRAIAHDKDILAQVYANYIENVRAYLDKAKVKDAQTGEMLEPDERLMRSIEERMGLKESQLDDARNTLMRTIGSLALTGKVYDFTEDKRLFDALSRKLFEESRDNFNLRAYATQHADAKTRERIDIVKDRLIRNFGYDDESAELILHHVATIFARGDAR